MFEGCSSLTSITIPDSVTSIGFCAFSSCSSLTSITIPQGVTSIGKAAFRFCSSLTDMVVDENNNVYDSRDNCNAIIETDTNTLIAVCVNTLIPDSVINIGDSAFEGCTSLTSVVIPDNITSIGGWAFAYCHRLTSITIPSSVSSIGDFAFDTSYSLTDVYYCGTEKQWEEIEIGEYNDSLLNAELHYNYVVPTEPGTADLSGDANMDGDINIKDATEIQKAVAGLLKLDEAAELSADVDGSGDVNIKDATAIQKWVAGIEIGFDISK